VPTSSTDTPPYPASYFERAPEQQHISGDKEPATSRDLLLAAFALEIIPPMLDWHDRNYIGMAVWRATDGHEDGFEAWCQWLERSGRFNRRAAEIRWHQYGRSKPVKLGLGTLIYLADNIEPGWQQKLYSIEWSS
jgi:Primase C terminal 2 (PriCT-2)